MLKTMMVAAAIAAATPAHAQDAAAIPDPHVTPGAVVSTERAPACAEVHTRRPNMADAARRVLELYGVPWSARGNYEIDHLVPRCLDGADTVLNL